MSLGLLRTFGDVVAIDSARHGLESGFFRSKMSGGSEDSFFVSQCTILAVHWSFRSTQIGPSPDFSTWGGPGDPRAPGTGLEIFVGTPLAFGDVIRFGGGRHGIAGGFFSFGNERGAVQKSLL